MIRPFVLYQDIMNGSLFLVTYCFRVVFCFLFFVSLILFSTLCFHFRFVFVCVSFFRKCFAVSGFVLLFSGCVFLFVDAGVRLGFCISVSCLAFFLFFVFAVVTQFLEKNYCCIVVLASLENLYTPTAFIFFLIVSEWTDLQMQFVEGGRVGPFV